MNHSLCARLFNLHTCNLGIWSLLLVAPLACESKTTPSSGGPSETDGSGSTGGASDGDGDGAPMGGAGGTPAPGNGGDSTAPGSGGDSTSLSACDPVSPNPLEPKPPRVDPLETGAHDFYRISVQTEDGTPIRGARLRTVGHIELSTDDNGNAAFYEPGLMGLDVYFFVEHSGFERAQDAFGYRGVALPVQEGGEGVITMAATSGEQGPSQGDFHTRLLQGQVPSKSDCVTFHIIDEDGERGVPLVRLGALGESYWSDSAGIIAYCNPDHLGQEVEFEVFSHGYELSAGAGPIVVDTTIGSDVTIAMRRMLAGERLYRITGAGVYSDSVKLGLTTPLDSPVINAQVIGSDTADATIYRGKYFWLWQDTHRVSYPLGNFSGTAATSDLPANGGLPASQGVNLTYFVGEDGFARAISEPFEPGGPVWMAGLVSVPDENGEEQLFASYAKVSGDASPLETGMMQWDPEEEIFERVATNFLDLEETDPKFVRPDSYATKFTNTSGQEHVYYPRRIRIPAEASAIPDPSRYEKFTAYDSTGQLQTLEGGALHYAYRTDALPTTSQALQEVGVSRDQDLDGHLREFSTGSSVQTVQSHAAFNTYRKRFLREAQSYAFSDIYFAEADTPVGPWVFAEKVVTHDGYNFYNTTPHPPLGEGGGRYTFFESTYTTFLFPEATPTPRYDYNQILYRLDLEDDRLILPVPVYELSGEDFVEFSPKQGLRPAPAGSLPLAAPMLAFDRPKQGTVPIRWSHAACIPGRTLVVGDEPGPGDLFFAYPPEANTAGTTPLFIHEKPDGSISYKTESSVPGANQTGVLAHVYENPIAVRFPVRDFLGPVVADAGDDQCHALPAGVAKVRVTLDGGDSVAPLGSSMSWVVRDGDACEEIAGGRLDIELSPGTHAIELVVEAPTGEVDTDWVLITIVE